MSKYPTHDDLSLVEDESNSIGQFLEWLAQQNIELCYWDEDSKQYHPDFHSIEQLLALFFDIDLSELRAEKDQMLSDIRAARD